MAIVAIQNLTKVYGSGPTAVTALDQVSLSVDKEEFVAVMGPSGCGNSTLLNMIVVWTGQVRDESFWMVQTYRLLMMWS